MLNEGLAAKRIWKKDAKTVARPHFGNAFSARWTPGVRPGRLPPARDELCVVTATEWRHSGVCRRIDGRPSMRNGAAERAGAQ